MAGPTAVTNYGNPLTGGLRAWTADHVRLDEVLTQAHADFEHWRDQVGPLLELSGSPTN